MLLQYAGGPRLQTFRKRQLLISDKEYKRSILRKASSIPEPSFPEAASVLRGPSGRLAFIKETQIRQDCNYATKVRAERQPQEI